MNLGSLFRQVEEFNDDTPRETVQEALAGLRSALTRGLESNSQELRSFLTLADRFGSHADAWNAARLLEEEGPLDPLAKAFQVSAWLNLFPETARSRPSLLLELIGPERAGLSASALSGLLSRWLESALSASVRLGRLDNLAQTFVAAAELANCWWPEDSWADKAPGFSSSFIDVAREVATGYRDGRLRDNAKLGRVLATALLVSQTLEAKTEAIPEVIEQEKTEPDPQVRLDQDDLAALIERINGNRRRIWVVGALRAKWEHLMGVAKSMGLEPSIFNHVDYDELKGRSLFERIHFGKDFGVLLGPVPHSTQDQQGYSSLATQLRSEAGIYVIDVRAQSGSQELKISKSGFRSALEKLLDGAAMAGIAT